VSPRSSSNATLAEFSKPENRRDCDSASRLTQTWLRFAEPSLTLPSPPDWLRFAESPTGRLPTRSTEIHENRLLRHPPPSSPAHWVRFAASPTGRLPTREHRDPRKSPLASPAPRSPAHWVRFAESPTGRLPTRSTEIHENRLLRHPPPSSPAHWVRFAASPATGPMLRGWRFEPPIGTALHERLREEWFHYNLRDLE
jgi:hypothetical protein